MPYLTDAHRWRALTTRDRNANGLFVYSVKSTNVYCRPICPARLARRANVSFYKTSQEAEADGFRACKRCKPNSVLEDTQQLAVEKACKLIDEAIKNDDPKAFRLQDLSNSVGLTTRYFHKIFKDKMGMTPKEYASLIGDMQSSSSATPGMTESLATTTTPELEDFDFNNFSELVDFDADASATLGFNLMTGASQASAMGFGNAIDVNILHEMWNVAYEPNDVEPGYGIENKDFINTYDAILVSDASIWHSVGTPMPAFSTFDLDAAFLLGNDFPRVSF